MTEIDYPKSTSKPSIGRRALRGGGKLSSWMFRTAMKLLLILVFVGVGLFIGGFLQFASKISDTVQPIDVKPADAIVALTGGSTRIATALELLSQQKGKRLLISGVNRDTQTNDIRAMHPENASLFDCCVDLERVAEDTIGNATETTKWVTKNGFESLIIVTSAYHMPRSMLEYNRLMGDITLTPFPVTLESINQEEWWKNATTLRFMVNEYLKYIGARARDYINPQTFDALRGNMFGSKEL
ncbi:MAG: YdcF family protein [Rhizobiaceae bacterium]